MDTISRENNSILPLGGVIVGVVALLLGGYAAFSLPNIKKQLADHASQLAQLPDIASQASAANSAASAANSKLDSVAKQTNDAFTAVGNEIGNMKAEIAKLEEAQTRPHGHGAHGDVVAGPGEYVIRAHDTSWKIARANGVSHADLLAVNPGLNWAHLHVGQKIKLPEKAPAAQPQAQPQP